MTSILVPKLNTSGLRPATPAELTDWARRLIAFLERGGITELFETVVTEVEGPPPLTHEYSASLASGAGFDPSAHGCEVDDLVVFFDPATNVTYGGTGGGTWVTSTYGWPASIGGTAYVRWKKLVDLAAITRGASGENGLVLVYRGAPVAAHVASGVGDGALTTLPITWPTPDPLAIGSVVFVSDYDASSAPATPGSWVARQAVNGVSAYMVGAFDQLIPPTAGLLTFTGFTGVRAQIGLALELRSA